MTSPKREILNRQEVEDEVARLLLAGTSPADIANQLRLPINTVFRHCDALIVAGGARRSDILFSVPKNRRELLVSILRRAVPPERATETGALVRSHLEKDIKTFARYALGDPFLGDLYEYLRGMELAVHRHVCTRLAQSFGSDDWWTAAVPDEIRTECERRRSGDRQPSPALSQYLSLGQLERLIDLHWQLFRVLFPPGLTKTRILADLKRLTAIRNWVMHPARQQTPTRDDFAFIRRIKAYPGFCQLSVGE